MFTSMFLFSVWFVVNALLGSPLNHGASGVARAFPGGRVAHPERQNEEENKSKFEENEESGILAHRDCEAGYGPAWSL